MSDAYSNARKARLGAEEYMEKNGWKKNTYPNSSLAGWVDPLPPHEEHHFDDAWDIQYTREEDADLLKKRALALERLERMQKERPDQYQKVIDYIDNLPD